MMEKFVIKSSQMFFYIKTGGNIPKLEKLKCFYLNCIPFCTPLYVFFTPFLCYYKMQQYLTIIHRN